LLFHLFICLLVPVETLAQSLLERLSQENYNVNPIRSPEEFLKFLGEHNEKIDCLVVLNQPTSLPIFNQMYEQGVLLPTVLIDATTSKSVPEENHSSGAPTYLYHSAEVRLSSSELETLPQKIAQAINQFLHLGHTCSLSEPSKITADVNHFEEKQSFLLLQQHRLAEKLKERLGYLGVYYRRNSQLFYRNLDGEERKNFLEALSEEYRQIILNYFSKEVDINAEIDQFVNKAFFSDLSVSQVLEIHMELMDQFSQQLKLEGRSEEILLDYRLAVIDILAHLCEMYRRSIPREDLPYDFLWKIQ